MNNESSFRSNPSADEFIGFPKWREMNLGDEVKSWYQCYTINEKKWKITSICLGTKVILTPFSTTIYRIPNSMGAWVQILPPFIFKEICAFFRRLGEKVITKDEINKVI